MSTVYITNKGGHNYSAAERYGKLVFLTEGQLHPFDTSTMHRTLEEGLKDSQPTDYILLTSLTVLNVIATSIFTAKHRCLNLLLFDRGVYVERNMMF